MIEYNQTYLWEMPMYSNYEATALIAKFNEKASENSRKTRKILAIVIISLSAVIAAVLVSVDLMEHGDIVIPLMGFVGIVVIALIAFFFLSKIIAKSKLTNGFLFPEIYRKINDDLSLSLNYDNIKKTDNQFVYEGSIFPKACTVYVYRRVFGNTESLNKFYLFDCSLITGGGQYQQIHHNGIYLFFKIQSDSVLQLRTHGRPQTKKHKFVKVLAENEFSVFKADNDRPTNFERALIQKAKELKFRLNAKRLYLNLSEGVLHFAYQSKNIKRAQIKIDPTTLNEIYQSFTSELRLVDEFVNLTEFSGGL